MQAEDALINIANLLNEFDSFAEGFDHEFHGDSLHCYTHDSFTSDRITEGDDDIVCEAYEAKALAGEIADDDEENICAFEWTEEGCRFNQYDDTHAMQVLSEVLHAAHAVVADATPAALDRLAVALEGGSDE